MAEPEKRMLKLPIERPETQSIQSHQSNSRSTPFAFASSSPTSQSDASTMISRSAIGRPAQLALRRGSCVQQPANRRGLAASVSGSTSFSYQSSDVNGLKVASRDVAGPTTKLAIVAKAGTRYQPAPGLTAGLEQFAFKVRTRTSGGDREEHH